MTLDYVRTIDLEPTGFHGGAEPQPFIWRPIVRLKDPTGQEWKAAQIHPPYLQADHFDWTHTKWDPAVFLWRPITEDFEFFWFVHRHYPLNEYTHGAYGGKYELVDGREVTLNGAWSSNPEHFFEATGLELDDVAVQVGQYALSGVYLRKVSIERFIQENGLPIKYVQARIGRYNLVPDWFEPTEEEDWVYGK